MKLLLRYLKPFILTIFLCLAALFIQAMCELYLPNLMSDMVDTGIQKHGIEEGAPEAISAKGYRFLLMFMDEEDQSSMNDGYTIVQKGDEGISDLEEQFPSVQSGRVYVLTETDEQRLEKMNKAYYQALYALTLSLEALQGETNKTEQSDFDIDQLYRLVPLLTDMNKYGELDDYISQSNGQEDSAKQLSTLFTRLFYKELGADLTAIQHQYIIKKGTQMLAIALLCVIATVTVGWFASKIATTVAKRMRRDIFKKVGSFSNAEYDRFSTASLITRSTNDIQQVQQMLIMAVRMMCFAPTMGIGAIIMALGTDVSMSWTIVVAIAAILAMMFTVFLLVYPKFQRLQRLIDKVNLISRENLSGMMAIRTFRNEEYEENRFWNANDNLRRTNRFIQITMAFMMPAMTLIMNMITLLIVWVGAEQIAGSNLQIGEMMAFMQYAMHVILSFMFIAMMFIMIPRSIVSANRVGEVLDTPLVITDAEEPVELTEKNGIIEFHDVSFRYDDAEESVLKGISFTASPGETTAIIGATGSGKSTLINLIPRFYDVSSGSVTLDGEDIRLIPQQQLRDLIGYVPQKGFLFSGNIGSNIRYGKENAAEGEIWTSLEIAQGKEFVSSFENGLETKVSQGGSSVSGGQRQRLSIARALIKCAPVYIFDDSFSALDVKTDAALRKALKEYTANSTVILVAQRVSTVMQAEQIIMLDQGRIIGKGTHEQLMKSCTEYREMAESQLSKEAMA